MNPQANWFICLHWFVRCLVDYPCHPNVCNLDAHMIREGRGQMWSPGNDSVMKKLTWVTLGYHYNWTTKVHNVFYLEL